MTRLTEDHTVVQKLVKEGRLTAEEAYRHLYRNRIFQALGGEGDVVVELLRADLRVGDRLLLCSDGLTDEVPETEILRVLADEPNAEQACRALVAPPTPPAAATTPRWCCWRRKTKERGGAAPSVVEAPSSLERLGTPLPYKAHAKLSRVAPPSNPPAQP